MSVFTGAAGGSIGAGMSTPASSAKISRYRSPYRSRVWPPLVSSVTASPAAGSTRRNAACPMVLPSWPTSRWPSQPNRIQPMPQESPSTYLSGTSAWNSVIAAALAADSTRVPSAARPPVRCIRANASTSAGVEVISPAGPSARGGCQTRATTGPSPLGPARPERPRQLADRGENRLITAGVDVPGGGAEQQRLLRQRHRVLEPERCVDPLPQRGVPGQPGQLLDHPAGQREAGAAVRPGGAERVVLLDVGHQADVLLHAVVAAAGVGEHVAVDTAGVVEQVPHGDGLGGLAVVELKLRQHLGDRRVEVELALVDQLHGQGRGPYLGHGADLEEGIGGRLDLRGCVRVAVGGLDDLVGAAVGAQPQDAERRARDLVPLGEHRQAALPMPTA